MIVDFLNQPNDDTAIYTVSTICYNGDGSGWEVRRWSFYYSLQEAIETIENNVTDIFEDGYYNYGIVEKYYPGAMFGEAFVTDNDYHFGIWFEYDHKEGKAHKVNCPKQFERICDFFKS